MMMLMMVMATTISVWTSHIRRVIFKQYSELFHFVFESDSLRANMISTTLPTPHPLLVSKRSDVTDVASVV